MKSYEGLRHFLELARTLHFGKAAAHCHVSASGLSRSIRRLEDEVGWPLFERDQRAVSLTPAGEAFQAYAAEVLDGWAEFEQGLRAGADTLVGTLHVYCTVTAAQSVVPDVLAAFRARHPEVRLELITGYASDVLDRVRDGSVDVGIVALPPRLPDDIAAWEVGATPVVFVRPATGPVHAATRRRRVDWAAMPMVLPTTGLARTFVDQWFRNRQTSPTVASEVLGHEAVLALVALGVGVGVVPALVLEKSALRDRVEQFDVRPALPSYRLAVTVRRRSLANPLVAALWRSLEEST